MNMSNLSDWDVTYDDPEAPLSKILKYFEPMLKINESDLLDNHTFSSYIPYASLRSLALVITAICSLLVTWKITYNIFFSPLRHIPGPPLAKITSKWLTFTELSGNRSLAVFNAHQKYGPVVRIAPDELSFSDPACIKELYMQASKFPKSRRYDGFASGTRASFDMTDKEQHRQRRNLVRHVLATGNVDDAEPLIGDAVRKGLRWIKRVEGKREGLDVLLWMRRVMLDTAGALFLGRDLGALTHDEEPPFLKWMDDFFAVTALRWFCPWLLTLLTYLPVPSIQYFLGAQKRSYEYGRKVFKEYIDQYGRYSGRIDLLTKMVGTPESKPLSDEQISDELGSLLVGATDTTVVVSTWMLWRLARGTEWQLRIRDELKRSKVEFPDGVPLFRQISSLPALNGFIMESMRLHPAQSIGLPRVAGSDDVKLGDTIVPAGTTVSVQSRNVQRDPEIFPKPHDFIPERWIETSGGTKEMKDSFIIFSKGSRSCLGQYVAFMELKLVIASLVNGWNMRLGEETTEEVMRQTDYFLAFPKGRKCWLVFEKVQG